MTTFNNSTEAFNAIFTNAVSSWGASMGRPNEGTKPANKRVFNRAVPFVDGAYDKGGAYWGMGKQLRVEYTQDLSYINFYRAE